ncbi:hypothetical protein SGFS_047760 [Streptomyces graminofaciens]|uniref:DUF3592 domain-containing protein n=1 Tax=Streptomyces graminofaciens TaxID=68212 RepID=A0ABM7FBG9_9ACTN|nr:DUF3592 domain-containing protein [Streptomyces graminofaciens]BBC33482.1 hypothetical protein SGFS_047760 [Streptomyces graminofaciens]
MDLMFYALPGAIAIAILFAAAHVVRGSLRLRSAWNSGQTAEGRCLRTFTTTRGGGETRVYTVRHHVFEFTAQDGRPVRFEEEGCPATILEGDFVTVYYKDGQEADATAKAPSPVGNATSTVGQLAFLGLVLVFCVGFMITYHQMSTDTTFQMP